MGAFQSRAFEVIAWVNPLPRLVTKFAENFVTYGVSETRDLDDNPGGSPPTPSKRSQKAFKCAIRLARVLLSRWYILLCEKLPTASCITALGALVWSQLVSLFSICSKSGPLFRVSNFLNWIWVASVWNKVNGVVLRFSLFGSDPETGTGENDDRDFLGTLVVVKLDF